MNLKLKKLYELTNEISKLDPWEWLYDIDLFAIQPRRYLEPFFVSIMGHQESCYGISVYYGGRGFADFEALAQEDPGLSVAYLMSDISCYTCYFEKEETLEDEDLWTFQDMGIEPVRDDRYFYFLSFEPRYYPYRINEEETNILVDVFEGLYHALKEWMDEHTVDADWEKNEIIFACEDELGWHLSTVMRPDIQREYPKMTIDDEYLETLIDRPMGSQSLSMELMYCNTPVFDDEGLLEKPMNPLMLIVCDNETNIFLATDFLDMDDDEVGQVFDWLTEYIEKVGIPEEIRYHNPYIGSALQDVCERLNIEMVHDDLEDINEFMNHVFMESMED